jgi:hypothetical protein
MTDNGARTTIITGNFNDLERATLVALIRHMDGQRPDLECHITAFDPRASLAEAEHDVRKLLPPRLGRETVFTTLKKP